MLRVSWNLANCHETVQKLLVRQVLNKLKLWSWRVIVGQITMRNKHAHSIMTRSSRFHCSIGVINKPTTDELWTSLYHLYTDDLLWRNFLSPHLRLWAMPPFDRAHTTSYSTLIETIRLSFLPFSRYSRLFVKIRRFWPTHLHLAPPQGVIPVEFRGDLWRQKTRVPVLSCLVIFGSYV